MLTLLTTFHQHNMNISNKPVPLDSSCPGDVCLRWCVYVENIDNMCNTNSFTLNEMVHFDRGYWTWDAQIYVTYV